MITFEELVLVPAFVEKKAELEKLISQYSREELEIDPLVMAITHYDRYADYCDDSNARRAILEHGKRLEKEVLEQSVLDHRVSLKALEQGNDTGKEFKEKYYNHLPGVKVKRLQAELRSSDVGRLVLAGMSQSDISTYVECLTKMSDLGNKVKNYYRSTIKGGHGPSLRVCYNVIKESDGFPGVAISESEEEVVDQILEVYKSNRELFHLTIGINTTLEINKSEWVRVELTKVNVREQTHFIITLRSGVWTHTIVAE